MPTLLKMVAPFTVSSAVRCLLDINVGAGRSETLFNLKSTASYVWAFAVAFMAIFIALEAVLRIWPVDAFVK